MPPQGTAVVPPVPVPVPAAPAALLPPAPVAVIPPLPVKIVPAIPASAPIPELCPPQPQRALPRQSRTVAHTFRAVVFMPRSFDKESVINRPLGSTHRAHL